ncbi:MAG: hypothetical protein J6S49_05140 [Erysipelotrichaceae bacterium]|nr:hypothetical protein [Erysipelotrichaceae bacterium]
MVIRTYSNFVKKKNSTKRPTGGTEINVTLKENTSVLNPIFITKSVPDSVNYLYVPSTNRYYYVTDIKRPNASLIEIFCHVDVLASYKSAILNTSAMVEYTSSSDDVSITDPRNVPTSLLHVTPTSLSFSGVNFNTTGGYVLGVLSDHASGDSGVIDYYALTPAQMTLFCGELYSQNILDQIKNQFTNAMESLVSCIWLPLSGIGSGSHQIHIGRETLSSVTNASKITDRVITFNTGTESISFSSDSGGSGAGMTYLEKAPYCTGTLFLPFIGFVPLDMDVMAFTKNIQINGYADLLTGDIVYMVAYGGLKVSTFNGNIATKVPVSGASYDGVGIASGAITAIGGVAGTIATIASGGSAGAVAASAGAIAGGAVNVAKSTELHTMINGGNSSAVGSHLGLNPFVEIYQYVPSESDLTSYKAAHGMPYHKMATLSDLTGYVQCIGASVSMSGFESEKSEVNSYINSGFYIE